MELTELIQHPERLDRSTLYELRSLLALYPYYQTARLLMLQNLFLLHDPTFDEELRRAAIYITDRRTLFNLVEARHYQLRPAAAAPAAATPTAAPSVVSAATESQPVPSRTLTLIDTFLDSIPKDEPEEPESKPKRKPTPADAAVDYVAYLLETEGETAPAEVPEMKGQSLIDEFINHDKGRFQLNPEPAVPVIDEPETENSEIDTDEGYFTETLARIYIKQGRYSHALEIIRRLSLQVPKKNAYFADQIRFLEKLILNNNKNK